MADPEQRYQGHLVSWDDARGFGFIEAEGLTAPVFMHVKFLRAKHQRPMAGDIVRFTLGEGRDGGPAAMDAEIAGAPPPPKRKAQRPSMLDVSRLLAAVAILVGATIAYEIDAAPLWFPALYFVMTLGSGIAYWLDKLFAREQRQRVSENMLHFADAFFGIAGGLFAQHVFRHKTRKRSFRAVTRLIFIAHATLIAMVLGGLINLPPLASG
ncbi:MAG: DUF1294 domain-containing protein [Micropepsaceae bacterium]